MKHHKTCPNCKSKRTQAQFDGSYKCLNCKKSFGQGQSKLTGEGFMIIVMVSLLFISVTLSWVEVVKAYFKENYSLVYFSGLIPIVSFWTFAYLNLWRKYKK